MANVEARSLSALNHIAAHPPQYPINPTERKETLTLYISRVPGCRGKHYFAVYRAMESRN